MNIEQTKWKNYNLDRNFQILYTYSGIERTKIINAESPLAAWKKFKSELSVIAFNKIAILKII